MSQLSVNSVKSVKSTFNKLDNNSAYVQIAVSAGGGFVAGFVFFRVSKLLAICVGGAILTIELAVQSGIVTIDWNKVLRQQEQAQNRAASSANARALARGPYSPNERALDPELIDKAKQLVLSSARLSVAFLGGFLLGFGFA
ncbi:FUN14 domain-containing protein 1 [Drosophila novamexicana]|uniref:FUN14 domain-containing protein 1 n=1 Tax=Drosophila novamexicana TaxID=47314 RepID=UPI0011E5E3DC|nr:FUN14 domain-containing protein 1 [Drosophila novamexicana]